ncbi:MAG: hypothetical protein MUE46_17715, partial [Xanthomonadales bacterium]|nr:hypothetical protein [Xanthomonadales bacterium]
RGWWIAEVGLQSIFPGGTNLDHTGGGPNTRRLRQELFRPSAERIESADNLATLVFVSGTALATMSIAVGVLTMLTATLAAALGWALGTPERSIDYMVTGFVILFMPSIVATLLDQLFGRWIGTESTFARLLRALIRSGELLMLTRIWSPMLLTLVGSARTAWRGWMAGTAVYGLLLLLVAVQMGGSLSAERLFAGSTPFPREPSALRLDARHYARERQGRDRYAVLPFVEARVIQSDWLALTVPLDSRRDAALLEERCPDLATTPAPAEPASAHAAAQEQQHAQLRDCLDQLRPVHLNGQRVPAHRAQFHRDGRGALPALLYMIPITELPAERHLLTVGHTPEPLQRAEQRRSAEARDPPPWTIPFWRQPER